jgi:multimeric flavodoxin WrbA
MKKILVINGSGRKGGNAAGLAAAATEAMQKTGTAVKVYDFAEMNIHPCMACNSCMTGHAGCVQKDDMTPLLQEIADSDGILLTSPIYFGRVTAQIAAWVGRLISLMSFDKSKAVTKAQKLAVILTFDSSPEEKNAKEGEYITADGPNMMLGIKDHQTLLAGGLREKDAYKARADYLDKAKAMGEWLIA